MPDPSGPPPAPVNALTVDVEEYYHGVEFVETLGTEAVGRLPSRVQAQTERLLDVLDACHARATFFTLGSVARRHPRLVRAIAERGHDLASHGWNHTPVYWLGPQGFRADVRRAKREIEQASGRHALGYRAPNYSIRADTPWAFAVLRDEGHLYDSSVYPVVHDRYGFPDAPRFPHPILSGDAAGLWEVPIGTARFAGVNLPLGGGFFRLFPERCLRAAVASVNRRERRPVVLYVHPWELDPDQPQPPMTWARRFRHYAGLRTAERKLRGLLAASPFTSIEAAFPDVARTAPAPALRAG